MYWVIEEDRSEESYLPVMERTLRTLSLARGGGYKVVKYTPFADITYLPLVPNSLVIVYGSIKFLKQIQRYTQWKPGACVLWENYKYSRYFPWYYQYLFNKCVRWYPLSILLEKVDDLFECPMWIKSDAGDKTWSGGVYEKEDFIHESAFRLDNGLNPNTMMIIGNVCNPDFPKET